MKKYSFVKGLYARNSAGENTPVYAACAGWQLVVRRPSDGMASLRNLSSNPKLIHKISWESSAKPQATKLGM